jgi:hypothetical protein
MKTVMDDGTEVEGDAGHNSWVVGDKLAVIIDFAGVKEYVKGR